MPIASNPHAEIKVKQLKALVEDPTPRRAVIMDCVAMINAEVRSHKGLAGIAVKTAYTVVKAIKPGIIAESLDSLIDDFVGQLQPHYEAYREADVPDTLETFFRGRPDAVAESLLRVTDRRVELASNKTIIKAYRKLRPKGKEHVLVAVPRVGALLDKHTADL